jgi:hypothetical protein
MFALLQPERGCGRGKKSLDSAEDVEGVGGSLGTIASKDGPLVEIRPAIYFCSYSRPSVYVP